LDSVKSKEKDKRTRRFEENSKTFVLQQVYAPSILGIEDLLLPGRPNPIHESKAICMSMTATMFVISKDSFSHKLANQTQMHQELVNTTTARSLRISRDIKNMRDVPLKLRKQAKDLEKAEEQSEQVSPVTVLQ